MRRTRVVEVLAAWAVALTLSGSALAQGQSGATTQPTGSAPAAGSAARLEINGTDFDFGEVYVGMPAVREFTAKNVGDAPLMLDVQSSCGCTVATKPKSPLPPGESTTFSISYSTSYRGTANKTVTLNTNDPTQRSVTIKVHGEVKPLLAMTPGESIVFQGLDTDSTASQTIKLESKYPGPLQLKLKEGQDFGRYAVELKEIKSGAEYELTATTKPPLARGVNRATAVLETGLEKVNPVQITVMANILPRVFLWPTQLYVLPTYTEPVEQIVRVQYRPESPVKITQVKPSLDAIQWEILPSATMPAGNPGAVHQIRVKLPKYEDLPPEGGKLEIYTDDKSPEYQKLEVQIVRRDIASGAVATTRPQAPPAGPPPNAESVRKEISDALRRHGGGAGGSAASQPAGDKKP